MSKINIINTAFIKICDKLNLSETLHKKLRDHYKAISEYLNSCNELEDLKIYPQGSFAIGTTIKPFTREEYDLDFVCEKDICPFQLFNLIKEALKDNGRYKDIIEEKKRCVCINYAGDFHLDILPARPNKDSLSKTGILIPDRKLQNLIPSDPKKYVDWFQQKTNLPPEADKKIETLPQHQNTIQKSRLQLIIQLMKRHRDIFFKSQSDQSPASIILTTLCGEYYTANKENILNSMIHITNVIINEKIMKVYNPVNSEELLSEKWEEKPKLYDKFIEWIKSVNIDLNNLKKEENLKEIFFKMFGETIAKPIINELKERENIHQNRSKLSVSSSGILSVSNKNNIPHNTFYGQTEEN